MLSRLIKILVQTSERCEINSTVMRFSLPYFLREWVVRTVTTQHESFKLASPRATWDTHVSLWQVMGQTRSLWSGYTYLSKMILLKRSVRVTKSSLMVKRNKFSCTIVMVLSVSTITHGKESTLSEKLNNWLLIWLGCKYWPGFSPCLLVFMFEKLEIY